MWEFFLVYTMDELIDILTKDGHPTGKTALKSEIHRKGYFHNTAHLWLYTNNKKILLAQRSLKKTIFPGLWDVSVAGHVDAGETVEQAIIRECQEEIGLTLNPSELTKIGVFPCFQKYDFGIEDNEFHHTFIAELKVPLTQLNPDANEVEDLQLVTFDDFINLLNNSQNTNYFVDSNRSYYETVMQNIMQLSS